MHSLRLGRDRTLWRSKIQGVFRINPQRHRIMGRAQVMTVFLVPVLSVPDRDVLRQIIVQRA